MLTASRFLDPKADVVFKKIFGQHADLLKSFLNGVMPFPPERQIVHLTYLQSEQVPRIPELKNTIVDVKCEDQNGRQFIIEMQMEWSSAFSRRMLYNVSKAYVQQLERGKVYSSLCPVYGLALLNDECEEGLRWYHHYRLQHVDDAHKTLEGIELILLELPKFQPATWQERKLGVLWLRFLSELKNCTTIPDDFQDTPELIKACELAQESAYSLEELQAYDEYWDALQTERTRVHDGIEKGLEQGRAEGRAEGELIGIEKGAHEAKLETAKKLKAMGMPDATICTVTALSLEDLKEI